MIYETLEEQKGRLSAAIRERDGVLEKKDDINEILRELPVNKRLEYLESIAKE